MRHDMDRQADLTLLEGRLDGLQIQQPLDPSLIIVAKPTRLLKCHPILRSLYTPTLSARQVDFQET